MPRREPLKQDQKRLLKIAARMPLASVANLAPVLALDEEKVRRMLGALRRGGWVTSVVRGMTERRQHRWFLTRRAVDLLYVTDHQHPAPREEARAAGLAGFHPEGELPEDCRERYTLDHDHPAHLEDQGDSPFAAGDPAEQTGDGPDHEHPPWTATSRGIETSLRRLAMLEPVYRLAPDLIRSGRVNRPPGDTAASREVRMPDFRLLRRGGFYYAVARYGPDLWTPFTYAGVHATERSLRRKEQHRFWGVDCYSHEEDPDCKRTCGAPFRLHTVTAPVTGPASARSRVVINMGSLLPATLKFSSPRSVSRQSARPASPAPGNCIGCRQYSSVYSWRITALRGRAGD